MSSWFKSEDWWSVWIGLAVCLLSLGVIAGVDLLGWGIDTKTWMEIGKATGPIAKNYAGLPGAVCLVLTYLFMLVLMSVGAAAMRFNLPRFAVGFSIIFWVSYLCWLIGNNAYI